MAEADGGRSSSSDPSLLSPSLAGSSPQVSKGTHILVPVGNALTDRGWSAEVQDTSGNTITLRVCSSPSTVIGKYQFSVKTRSKAGEYQVPFDPRNEVYILFNPWCSGKSQGRAESFPGRAGAIREH